jgi:hypothetical protein
MTQSAAYGVTHVAPPSYEEKLARRSDQGSGTAV